MENYNDEIGFGLTDLLKMGKKGLTKGLTKGIEKKIEEVKEGIKSDIRAEIKAGMIKMFLAGVASVLIGNFIFSRFSKS